MGLAWDPSEEEEEGKKKEEMLDDCVRPKLVAAQRKQIWGADNK